MRVARLALLALALGAVACASESLEPASLDTRNETCGRCRMPVSEARFASQVVAPGEVPRFFDDLDCLARFLKEGKAPAGAVAYVSDHRTGRWVRASAAVYSRVPGLQTPMGSHVVAHADGASRDQDPLARGATAVDPAALFGTALPHEEVSR